MALPFIPSDGALLALQAGVVAAPRAGVRIEHLERLQGRGWALVPLGSILVVVFAIRYLSDTATALTYLALVAVPPLAAVALAWGVRGPHAGSRGRIAWSVCITTALFVVAWGWHRSLSGEAAAAKIGRTSCRERV